MGSPFYQVYRELPAFSLTRVFSYICMFHSGEWEVRTYSTAEYNRMRNTYMAAGWQTGNTMDERESAGQ